jgi:DNA polymerase II small subunit/DNA polymerase delta subunit B
MMEERELSVALTDSEVNHKAQDLVALMLEFDTVEDEKRTRTAEFSEQLKELRNRMRALSRVIREKKEQRSVPCEVRFHSPVVGTKQTVRLDTNEMIEETEMTQEERQENLFGEHQEWNRLFGASTSSEEGPPTAA